MKKIVIVLLLAAVAAPMFAADAAVLPQGVGRLYLVPAYSFWSDTFDDDGERQDAASGDSTTFNLAAALEYGVTPWISAGLQYIPGYVFANDFSDAENVDATGSSSLDIGAKFQIIGPNAPVPNETMRLTFLPGLIVPLDPYDAEEAATDNATGDDFATDGVSNDSFGFGMQTAFDYFVTPEFYVNLFNEFRIYGAEDFEEAGIEPYVAWATANAGVGGALQEPDAQIYPGYDLTFEIEPTFQTMITDTIQFTGSLATTWDYSPGPRFAEDLEDAQGGSAVQEGIEDAAFTESHLLSLGPSAAFFLRALPVPMEFQFDASIPVWGRNIDARNTILFQWEIYFAF
ncbi:MAG: hypothetical protein MI724_11795 [Spirochaetales bacterium]|nr:hypothetical protein [Spirochaetales bacterium]